LMHARCVDSGNQCIDPVKQVLSCGSPQSATALSGRIVDVQNDVGDGVVIKLTEIVGCD
jgi:hypothetical protein